MAALGQGTWRIGDNPRRRQEEIAALQAGVELGMNLIDTAEMYGEGRAESLVGEALKGKRDSVFLVSKVYPHNAGRTRIFRSCEESLKRLGTDRLDLYLLHWRGRVPLEETVECMERLVEQGKIIRWGVSNFDTADMRELAALADGSRCAVNQVLYHLGSRGIEYDLLPWQRDCGMPIMAYSPLAQAGELRTGLTEHPAVVRAAEAHGASPLQILLAWSIRGGNVIAIPKASTVRHVTENAQAARITLSNEEIAALDEAFPPPDRKVPLDII
ncbi:aldo/keto reductase family protein [Paenibacillus macerans]|uniref:Aldo/keto reductase family protein n=1 Tax=Paenibacillus macerans TaxID=44252 RepID=A0A090ZVZ1_PAEMA|nr:aldo/keto reductase family protein [Paenibacillus macerans]